MFLHHRLWKIYEKNVNLYIAPSRFMKETVVSFGIPENKVEIIYNFIEKKSPVKPIKIKESYILYYGRLSYEKGIHVLLKSLSVLSNKPLLKVVGSGPELDSLVSLAKTLNISDSVEFLGPKFGVDLEKIILGSKAVIIPSVWLENMPFVLLESLALGKVVIASKTGGLPELIEEGKTGFLFENSNVEDLSNKIDNLDNYDLIKIGYLGQERVSEFGLENHYQKLLAVYKSLVK